MKTLLSLVDSLALNDDSEELGIILIIFNRQEQSSIIYWYLRDT